MGTQSNVTVKHVGGPHWTSAWDRSIRKRTFIAGFQARYLMNCDEIGWGSKVVDQATQQMQDGVAWVILSTSAVLRQRSYVSADHRGGVEGAAGRGRTEESRGMMLEPLDEWSGRLYARRREAARKPTTHRRRRRKTLKSDERLC